MVGFKIQSMTLLWKKGNEIFEFAGDAHSGEAVEEVAAVGFGSESGVEDGDDAAVGVAADETPDSLF